MKKLLYIIVQDNNNDKYSYSPVQNLKIKISKLNCIHAYFPTIWSNIFSCISTWKLFSTINIPGTGS